MPFGICSNNIALLNRLILLPHDVAARAEDTGLTDNKAGAAVEMPFPAIRAFVKKAYGKRTLSQLLVQIGRCESMLRRRS